LLSTEAQRFFSFVASVVFEIDCFLGVESYMRFEVYQAGTHLKNPADRVKNVRRIQVIENARTVITKMKGHGCPFAHGDSGTRRDWLRDS
jgi:hypothetical protein